MQGMLSNLDFETVKTMVEDEYEEDQFVEFKANPSAHSKTDILSDGFKRTIAEEVVGFLNSTGGMIIIGVEESAQNSHKASGITLIDDAEDVARRMMASVSSLIDPYPTGLTFQSISKPDGNGEGIICAMVPRSSNAPHAARVSGGLKVYVRRGDSKYPLQMSEVRTAVLENYDNRKIVHQLINDRREIFQKDSLKATVDGARSIGFQILFCPLNDLFLPPLWDIRSELRAPRAYIWNYVDGKSSDAVAIFSGGEVCNSTMLRGIRLSNPSSTFRNELSINRYGTVESKVNLLDGRYFDDISKRGWIYLNWIKGELAALGQLCEKMQPFSYPTGAGFAVTLSITSSYYDQHEGPKNRPLVVKYGSEMGGFEMEPFESPIYYFSNHEEFLKLCSEVEYDLLCQGGLRLSPLEVVGIDIKD